MSYTADRYAGKEPTCKSLGDVIQHGRLRCPHTGCEQPEMTHVVDVVWEQDPREGDRRWVRLEVRCEDGHGYLLLIGNHAGWSRIEYQILDGEVSPFAEGARW